MTRIKKIDGVLKKLNENNTPKTDKEIKDSLGFNIEDKELFLILDKLIRDENASFSFAKIDGTYVDIKCYYITYDGVLLLNSGGYKSKIQKEATQKFLLVLEKWLIVLGTVSAGLYGLVEFINWIRSC